MMKRWLGFVAIVAVLVACSLLIAKASFAGWLLPGTLGKPISVRQSSASGHGAPIFFYAGGRRHFGGGFGPGK